MPAAHQTFASLLAVVLVALSAGPAMADVISPAPAICPEGSKPRDRCHGPSTCEVTTCTGDGDCGQGQTCAERELCVRDQNCGGRRQEPIITHVIGPCSAGCDEVLAECRTLKVCVPRSGPGPSEPVTPEPTSPPPTSPPPTSVPPASGGGDGGCSCRVARPADMLGGGAVLAVGLLALFGPRRRR